MKLLFTLFLLVIAVGTDTETIYDFSKQSDVKEWNLVNDDVMGGISKSSLVVTEEGHGHFSGQVSLENNGGFASIQLNKKIKLAEKNKFIVLRVKGDGRQYEFRLKAAISKYESYVHRFNTSGEWEEIKLKIDDFYPQFRGRTLNIPNFNFQNIEQMSFLIANKKSETFNLLIDWIGIE